MQKSSHDFISGSPIKLFLKTLEKDMPCNTNVIYIHSVGIQIFRFRKKMSNFVHNWQLFQSKRPIMAQSFFNFMTFSTDENMWPVGHTHTLKRSEEKSTNCW